LIGQDLEVIRGHIWLLRVLRRK